MAVNTIPFFVSFGVLSADSTRLCGTTPASQTFLWKFWKIRDPCELPPCLESSHTVVIVRSSCGVPVHMHPTNPITIKWPVRMRGVDRLTRRICVKALSLMTILYNVTSILTCSKSSCMLWTQGKFVLLWSILSTWKCLRTKIDEVETTSDALWKFSSQVSLFQAVRV